MSMAFTVSVTAFPANASPLFQEAHNARTRSASARSRALVAVRRARDCCRQSDRVTVRFPTGLAREKNGF